MGADETLDALAAALAPRVAALLSSAPTPAPEPLLSTAEVCERWALDRRTVQRAIERGDLPVNRPKGTRLVLMRPSDVEAWIFGSAR